MGIPASACVSLTCWKAGDSEIFSRIKSPTPTRIMLSRNGTRQPQARNCSSESPVKAVSTAVEMRRPASAPVCGQLP
jgi:hypothetical protein